jgi:hypothetical protein
MPRFFIDPDDDDTYVEDEDGLGLPDAEAARKVGLAALSDIARDRMQDGRNRTFRASVRDEAGTMIYKATLTLAGEWRASGSAS